MIVYAEENQDRMIVYAEENQDRMIVYAEENQDRMIVYTRGESGQNDCIRKRRIRTE